MSTTADPSTWGWKQAGFDVPTVDNVRTAMVARFDALTGTSTPTNESSPVFLMASAFASLIAETWQAIADSVNALDPANAYGEGLDAVARRLNVVRLPATSSTASLTLSGTPGITVPAGSLFADPTGTYLFALDTDAVIGGGGSVNANATCTIVGPFAPATITQIVNPIVGLTGVALEAGTEVSPGEYEENDADLRLRLPAAAWSVGAGTREGIIAALLDVAGVTKAQAWIYLSDPTPPATSPRRGTFEPVVYPDSIAADLLMPAIYDNLVGGCDTYGAESDIYQSPSGDSRIIRWSYAAEVVIDVRVTDVVVDGTAPANWAALMVSQITALIDAYQIGQLVRFRQIQASALGMTGIVDGVVEIRKDGGSWITSNVAIGHRELAIAGTVTATA